ncbi:hypothetical protein [Leucobacter insecticola]|uniref:hypothetical protein n=1 Tax=Leucobacter insecticola TaxID=2714934 RepID=UPI001FCAEF18|nr:hypothetical protein [Leucobacter insecticola]
MCSDGLTTEIADDEILAVLTVGGRADAVADELIRLACAAGGRDNISVIIVDTVSAGSVVGAIQTVEDDLYNDETIEITKPVRR